MVVLREGIVVDETAPAPRNATGLVLSGRNATLQVNVNGDFEVTLTGAPPLGDLLPEELELELAAAAGGPTRFEVIGVDAVTGKVLLDRDPHISVPSGWSAVPASASTRSSCRAPCWRRHPRFAARDAVSDGPGRLRARRRKRGGRQGPARA